MCDFFVSIFSSCVILLSFFIFLTFRSTYLCICTISVRLHMAKRWKKNSLCAHGVHTHIGNIVWLLSMRNDQRDASVDDDEDGIAQFLYSIYRYVWMHVLWMVSMSNQKFSVGW